MSPAQQSIRDTWLTHDMTLTPGDDATPPGDDQEWLLTNGSGAFAMGTAAGVNTRRYHGLLVGARRPPVGRVAIVNQMLEQLTLVKAGQSTAEGGQRLEFNTCRFIAEGGAPVFAPHGYRLLRHFQKGLDVAWTYRWGGIEFERRLSLHWRKQAATLRYLVRGLDDADSDARLVLSPMLTLRDFHGTRREKDGVAYTIDAGEDRVMTSTADDIAVTVTCPGSCFAIDRNWWYNVYYPIEADRGLESVEDYFVPGRFEIDLKKSAQCEVVVHIALGKHPVKTEADLSQRADHLAPMLDHIGEAKKSSRVIEDDARRALVIAADDFVVGRTIKGRELSTILAGYPWFADWGRDTFIALPGLLLCTGRFDEARATLQTFAEAIRGGLVPNRFDDYDDKAAHYNTVDASLWFINAAMQYHDLADDAQAWDGWLRDACLSIIDAYLNGTEHGIRCGGDGLVIAGGPDTQLTWMDAKTGDTVFTPRHGKAVEINALWYHALQGMGERIKETHNSEARHFDKLAGRIRRAFMKLFWDDARGCLNDHIWADDAGEEHADTTIRPNQIFAASLPNSPLPMTKCKKVLATVRDQLLTPFGLRTLPADHPAYHGRYHGGPYQRDEAYHQGTVWPWLIGPYAEAVLRCGKFSKKAKNEAYDAIEPLLDHMLGPGLGQLSEIHEADPPHAPVGTPAQAWSIAEVLRVVRLIETGQ